ncbi:hypothetical protein D187_005078 [Cystobacter fuscus DSM 2262]|uniref:Uncharacterized protein n=1 Tax=Cystobacter fuscus (strain ATCC 25194 / DSM 2262 / NBRC 100088 / M29) TaxID=1242864 RepID=S9PHY1_CYSF2|nr:hypothetical protein D187_005078 [Cystobacter fuscus DSM 2262]
MDNRLSQRRFNLSPSYDLPLTQTRMADGNFENDWLGCNLVKI